MPAGRSESRDSEVELRGDVQISVGGGSSGGSESKENASESEDTRTSPLPPPVPPPSSGSPSPASPGRPNRRVSNLRQCTAGMTEKVGKIASTGNTFLREDEFAFTSAMTPWVDRQWWWVFMCHLFPLPMMLLFPSRPEHRAFFLKFSLNDGFPLLFKIRKVFLGHIMPTLLLIGLICSAYVYNHPKFGLCQGDKETLCKGGSIYMGITSPMDVIRDLYCIPTLAYVAYVALIAARYALLSASEYARYISETDPEKMLENMRLLDIYVCTAPHELSHKQMKDYHAFEMLCAAARSGTVGNETAQFLIPIPTQEDGDCARNFKNWQALLLGRSHHHGLDWKKIDHHIAGVMSKITVSKNEGKYYAVDMHFVLCGIMNWSNKLDFRAKRGEQVVHLVSAAIASMPFLGICRAKDFNNIFADANSATVMLVICLCFWPVTYLCLVPLFQTLHNALEHNDRKVVRTRLLREMLRSNDLDPEQTVPLIGITPSQKLPMPAFVDIYEDDVVEAKKAVSSAVALAEKSGGGPNDDQGNAAGKPPAKVTRKCARVVDKRNPNVARMPSISYSGGMSQNENYNSLQIRSTNVLTWMLMRSSCLNILNRQEELFQISVKLSMGYGMFMAMLLFAGFVQSLDFAANGQLEELEERGLYLTSPCTLQSIIIMMFILSHQLMFVRKEALVNTEYQQHYLELKRNMNRLEVLKSKYCPVLSGISSRSAYLELLPRISHAYDTTYKCVVSIDSIKYAKAYGVEANTSLLSFIVTLIGSVSSVAGVFIQNMQSAGLV